MGVDSSLLLALGLRGAHRPVGMIILIYIIMFAEDSSFNTAIKTLDTPEFPQGHH